MLAIGVPGFFFCFSPGLDSKLGARVTRDDCRNFRSFALLLKKACFNSSAAVGRLEGSFWRHSEIILRKVLPKPSYCFLSSAPLSRVGGSFCRVSMSTFIGGYLMTQVKTLLHLTAHLWYGAVPVANSIAVMPKLQMSAL